MEIMFNSLGRVTSQSINSPLVGFFHILASEQTRSPAFPLRMMEELYRCGSLFTADEDGF